MISFEKVTKTYNKSVLAVDDLSFEVKKGEIVGFIGPNGSGKTTTMKMLAGIISPDNGYIKIDEMDLAKEPLKVKQLIGYIADSPDMFLRLKGIEFLNFMADVYRVSKEERERRILDLATSFEMKEVLNSPMLSYSHGMRQKIMVIATLLHEPEVWVLDEPLTGLDPKSAYILKDMMRKHAAKGKSVFFSTHVLEVAEKLCDRVIIILKGKKLYDGTLDQLRQDNEGKTLEEIFLRVTGDDRL